MTILNRASDGLLSVLLALRRALVAFGPQEEDRLLELCAPSSVVPEGKPEYARKTLTRWKQLGFFQDRSGSISLSPEISAIQADDLSGLRIAVLRLVLAPENNPALRSELSDDHERTMASDFTRAIAWVLSQDPYAFRAKWKGVESQQLEQGIEPRPLANDTRWAGLEEWAPFIGLAWMAPKFGLVPDPSFAVRASLAGVFQGASELPQSVFFERLAETLPVVDGGRYRVGVESQIARAWQAPRPTQVSASLSAALLGLEVSGTIRLDSRSDAPFRSLTGRIGSEVRPVSHVQFLGAPHGSQ